jgi:tetratricopeptide (TPR) repeat protein
LFDQDKAQEYYRKAMNVDPEDLEVRSSYSGMLLDTGNLDEAVRQLNIVTQRNPADGMGWYLLSQTLCRKEDYEHAILAGRKAVAANPKNAEAHFWLGEAYRLGGKYNLGAQSYTQYLSLSDFDSKLAGQLNYYIVGYLIGMGKRKKAAQHDIWSELRGLGYFGRCDCERKLSQYTQAIGDCRLSLGYEPKDPLTHYVLGLNYMQQANAANDISSAIAAKGQFEAMLAINPELEESNSAKKNIVNIDTALAQLMKVSSASTSSKASARSR